MLKKDCQVYFMERSTKIYACKVSQRNYSNHWIQKVLIAFITIKSHLFNLELFIGAIWTSRHSVITSWHTTNRYIFQTYLLQSPYRKNYLLKMFKRKCLGNVSVRYPDLLRFNAFEFRFRYSVRAAVFSVILLSLK